MGKWSDSRSVIVHLDVNKSDYPFVVDFDSLTNLSRCATGCAIVDFDDFNEGDRIDDTVNRPVGVNDLASPIARYAGPRRRLGCGIQVALGCVQSQEY